MKRPEELHYLVSRVENIKTLQKDGNYTDANRSLDELLSLLIDEEITVDYDKSHDLNYLESIIAQTITNIESAIEQAVKQRITTEELQNILDKIKSTNSENKNEVAQLLEDIRSLEQEKNIILGIEDPSDLSNLAMILESLISQSVLPREEVQKTSFSDEDQL